MLTPLDIHNKEFKKGLRGYVVDEVDEFLDEVIKDFETIYKENLDLKDQLQKQRENINRYKELEETLRNTMVLAQKTSEEVKRAADKEAELILQEARQKAQEIVAGAHGQVIKATEELANLRCQEKQLVVKLKTFLRTQLELLEEPETWRKSDPQETREFSAVDFSGD